MNIYLIHNPYHWTLKALALTHPDINTNELLEGCPAKILRYSRLLQRKMWDDTLLILCYMSVAWYTLIYLPLCSYMHSAYFKKYWKMFNMNCNYLVYSSIYHLSVFIHYYQKFVNLGKYYLRRNLHLKPKLSMFCELSENSQHCFEK